MNNITSRASCDAKNMQLYVDYDNIVNDSKSWCWWCQDSANSFSQFLASQDAQEVMLVTDLLTDG